MIDIKNFVKKWFAVLALTIPAFQLWAATYYVSTTGNDGNSGSSASPFRTIKKAAAMVNPGDEVLISGGTYTENNIVPKSSGTESNYIVFKPNSGTGAVVLKHPATSVSDQSPVFQLSNKNYIWIEGLQFKDFKYGLACIYIGGGNGNVVMNNRFENLGSNEVSAWNGNQMVGIINGQRNVVFNNYFNNIVGDGINVNSQNSKNNLVCHNTFIGFKGKMRDWGGTNLFSRAVDMQDMSNGNNVTAFNYAENVIHHVWLDRDGSNNVLLRNYGNKGSGNIFNESRCRGNVIQENISVAMRSGYMSAYYGGTNWTLYPRWINNVAYNNTDGFVIHKSVEDEFRNNISYNNTDNSIEFSRAAKEHGPHIFKNNLWYSSSKTNSILYNHIPATTSAQQITDKNGNVVTLPAYNSTSPGSVVSPASFRTSVGETNGLSVNPLFVSATDFRLQSSSPAKGAGDNGLDLGAYAYYTTSNFGWNSTLNTSSTAVYFEQAIATATRGSNMQITLRLSKASSQQVSVDIVPVAGDAVVGQDFLLSTTKVTFLPGETSKTVTMRTGNSATYDELVALRLQNTTNAVAGGRMLEVIRFKAGNAAPLSNVPTITITSPANNTVFAAAATITINATASVSNGSISNVQFFSGTTLLGSDNTAPYSYSWTNVAAGTYTLRAVATDNLGQKAEDTQNIKVTPPKGPYGGTAHPIPGTIQLEHYDEGGNGIAYLDNSPESSAGVAFRNTEDVDIENCEDVGGGYNIGYATSGEWLEYTVNVAKSANYDMTLRVACNGTGRTVAIAIDGSNLPNSSAIAIPNTTAWQTWTNVTILNIPLTAGQKVMRLTIGATDYVNLNYVQFKESLPTDNNVTELGIGNSEPAIYPNPFNSHIIVEMAGSFQYQLMDMASQVVDRGNSEGKLEMGVGLPKGVYILKITQGNKNKVVKVVKE